jgi:hypothetical protein
MEIGLLTVETAADAVGVPVAADVIVDAVGAVDGPAAVDGIGDAAGRAGEDTRGFFATDLRGFAQIMKDRPRRQSWLFSVS